MSKVIKAFSLDRRTVDILEDYCKQSDNWDKTISRSKVVNDAIVWFLRGDTAELVHNNEKLMEAVKRANKELISPTPTNRPLWRRLLLGQ